MSQFTYIYYIIIYIIHIILFIFMHNQYSSIIKKLLNIIKTAIIIFLSIELHYIRISNYQSVFYSFRYLLSYIIHIYLNIFYIIISFIGRYNINYIIFTELIYIFNKFIKPYFIKKTHCITFARIF